jgi:tRNA dimethylallyltransferase
MARYSNSAPIVVIVGATAVGKSDAAIELAAACGGEVISADSRQVYRGMEIGTAKPTAAQRARVPHHLIDVVAPDEPFNAGRFRALAADVIERLRSAGRMPIVVGGTGLYVRALVRGLWNGPAADWPLRRELLEQDRQRPGALHERLARLDPDAAARIHAADLPKLVRALEVALTTGRPLSEHHRAHDSAGGYAAVLLGLRRRRDDLYARIDLRVERMLAAGLVEEVSALRARGFGPELGAMKGLGYRQIVDHLEGRSTLAEAVARLKRDTRRYAKRQETWFRREPGIDWIELQPADGTAAAAAQLSARLERWLPTRERTHP